jgi:hypothetical protein
MANVCVVEVPLNVQARERSICVSALPTLPEDFLCIELRQHTKVFHLSANISTLWICSSSQLRPKERNII